ncbi:5-formyltetrahydrofolate cyclo-ligase [Ignatzschineria sp. LJL83]
MTDSHIPHSSQLPMIAHKTDLRTLSLSKRKAFTPNEVAERSHNICQQVIKSILPNISSIHLFLPIAENHEVDLTSLLPILWEKNISVYVPRVTSEGKMEHVPLLPETTLVTNNWGIPEPAIDYLPATTEEMHAMDCVLTPLLVCDQEGFRVGYGGGFYDTFFQEYPHLQKIGVGFFEPIEKISDTYEGDIPLNGYISPETMFHFSSNSHIDSVTNS